jgi:hypothetical protein
VALAAKAAPEPQMFSPWTSRHWDMLRSEGLGPWFYQLLSGQVELPTDSDILTVLQHDYKTSATAHLRREATLRRIFSAFNDRGIPVALLKGAYLGNIV